jgi:uroporphyrinogen III methyltransferase/synthase
MVESVSGSGERTPPRGKVYLVGAGPGDAGLLTLRGKRCLARADVVVYDYLANPALLCFARPEAERVFCGKHGRGPRIMSQEEINALLIDKGRAGKTVVRLKGGDPFLFGRGAEEACELVAAGIPFEVVPGVSSATAVPAYAGIPLTHRECTSTVTFISGQPGTDLVEPSVPWARLTHGGTLVLLMSVSQLGTNLARLCEEGLAPSTPAALVRWGTMPFQQTIVGTVADLAERAVELGLKPPAVVVVGEVVRLRDRLRWFETRPLFGRCIVVTRARLQASQFVDRLEGLGADVMQVPAIEIVPPVSYEPLDAALKRLGEYRWVIFTSVNGVGAFLERLREIGGDTRWLGQTSLAAIGSETARALAEAHLRPDIVPQEYRAEALAAALRGVIVCGQRVLLPRAAVARSILPETLRSLGAVVDDVAAYRTRVPENVVDDVRRRLNDGAVDLLTFASSSTVRYFVDMVGTETLSVALAKRGRDGRRRVEVGCIGPVTAMTARELGLPVDIQPATYTIPAFVEAIVARFCNAG